MGSAPAVRGGSGRHLRLSQSVSFREQSGNRADRTLSPFDPQRTSGVLCNRLAGCRTAGSGLAVARALASDRNLAAWYLLLAQQEVLHACAIFPAT
jgi:hypothetical protein